MKGIRPFLYPGLLTRLVRVGLPWIGLVLVGLVLVGAPGLGFAQAPTSPPGRTGGLPFGDDVVSDPRYRIGPRDLVSIEVFELPELNGERRVSTQGSIRLPVIGDFPVAGRTEQELAADLETALEASYVERASVTVQVLEIRSRSFTVIGAARQPGEYGLPSERTLLEAITTAGGLADNHGSSIHILRRADNGLTDQLTVRVEDLLERADPRVNVPIQPNDLINIEKTESLRVYLLGEVATPGEQRFDTRERATLLYAIARAGGLGDRASPKIVIQRRGESGTAAAPGDLGGGEVEQIQVSYKRIVAGKEPDIELRDGDVIIVKESFF